MNDFDNWNEIKKKVDSGETLPDRFPKEGEDWMSTLGKNVGFEQNGSGSNFARPVLIVKKFNNQMFWTVALSTKQKPFDFYHNFTDPNSNEVSAILAQLKLLSVKRLDRKLYDLPEKQLREIKDKLKKFLQ
ncbi:MAG: type II toxin-antitoxin system PemK/MazF family toxin [Candidatus Vogelbacteria bacterium]|nr:type II toxin-antitoxin system PemK/MazF family toxin [Candidatus Vogelbacteria bacterium]